VSSITQTVTTSFKLYLLDLVTPDYKIALYDSDAVLDATTTAYTTTGEITGTGYTAGGATLTLVSPTTDGTVALIDFANPTWAGATFTARAAMIYLDTGGNPSVAVLNFGEDKQVSASTFEVEMPLANATSAIVRIA
jgi:hypothetical protein